MILRNFFAKIEARRYLNEEVIWDFITEKELINTFRINKKEVYGNVQYILNNYAIALFKRNCSYLGLNYKFVEKIYFEKNEQFFKLTNKISYSYTGKEIISFASNIILPRVTFNELEYVANILKRLSKEQTEELIEKLKDN